MKEIWLPISRYEGFYEISNLGRVRSLPRLVRNTKTSNRVIQPRILKTYPHPGGYLCVKLSKSRGREAFYIHRLVAFAFHGQPENGQEVLHYDGKKTNNAASNLSWGSRKDNFQDRYRLGEAVIGERHGCHKLTEKDVLKIRKDSRFYKVVAADYSVCHATISMIKRRVTWRHVQG